MSTPEQLLGGTLSPWGWGWAQPNYCKGQDGMGGPTDYLRKQSQMRTNTSESSISNQSSLFMRPILPSYQDRLITEPRLICLKIIASILHFTLHI